MIDVHMDLAADVSVQQVFRLNNWLIDLTDGIFAECSVLNGIQSEINVDNPFIVGITQQR